MFACRGNVSRYAACFAGNVGGAIVSRVLFQSVRKLVDADEFTANAYRPSARLPITCDICRLLCYPISVRTRVDRNFAQSARSVRLPKGPQNRIQPDRRPAVHFLRLKRNDSTAMMLACVKARPLMKGTGYRSYRNILYCPRRIVAQ